MEKESFSSLFEQTKTYYFSIGKVYCPALNEWVRFNKHGFIHLFRKGRKYRKPSDQIRRISILPDAVTALRQVQKVHRLDTTVVENSTAFFWDLRENINGTNIRVVVRQLNNGKKHFFSVMNE